MEKLKKIFIKNLPLKILSILVAFLLWLNITSMQKAKVELYIPIEVRNVPESIVITKIKPDKVLVTIEGYKNIINNLNIENINAYADGKSLKPGTNILKVHVELPSNLKVVDIRPKTIIVRVIQKKEGGKSL